MKSKIIKIVIPLTILLAAAVILESTYIIVSGGSGAEGQYRPSLEVNGDVVRTAELTYEDGTYVLECGGEKKELLLKAFTFEGEKHSGVLLSDILSEAETATEKTHIYYAGWDGMAASIDAAELDENYILFGENGWEAMNIGYPASCNVKEMKSVTAVADSPSDVSTSVTVEDDGGYEHTVSPGTLLMLTERISSARYHGQNEKSGRTVTVFTTDTWWQIGENRLTAEGNEIKNASEIPEGSDISGEGEEDG